MGVWTQFRIATVVVVASLASSNTMVLAAGPAPVATQQGPDWTPASRDEFYSLDQGSRIMPLRWIMALKLPDGRPFMADSLRRYGFLPNEASPAGLPVGFTTAGQPGKETIGMSCAACHTRQIEFAGVAYRIDGGPAIIDFQAFLSDLNNAVSRVVNERAAFTDFARAVLGDAHTSAEATALRQTLGDWYRPYNLLISKGLPPDPWGPGRLDAIGMIFNRLTGLDLGPGMEDNIEYAEAPVRYPFLWNAARQEWTQWTGFASNENETQRLLRNIGQVIGVFAEFQPKKDPAAPLGVNYWVHNSIDISGLRRLEDLMKQIGPPRWPWKLDDELAEKGKTIYETAHCVDCHSAKPDREPWETPIRNVNTDSRQLTLVNRMANSGELAGAQIPSHIPALDDPDHAMQILKVAIVGTLATAHGFAAEFDKLEENFQRKPGYEARVLHGVWAAAPYLHNGSVPTLTELLKPAAERTPTFKIGSAYDPETVGLATEQTQFSATLTTTDCSDRNSGNSRCGHEFGTELSETDKRALLEYLKKL